MARRTVISTALGVVIAIGITALVTSGPSTRPLRAVFTAATQLRSGNEVRIAGRTVGSVGPIRLDDDEALVTMNVDSSAWPLHQGTTAQIRFGSAASYASRYIQLQPGPARNAVLASNALLPEADTVTPVEFDQMLSQFTKPTETNIGTTLQDGATLLNGQADAIKEDLNLGSSGLGETAGLMSKLGLDPAALGELMTSGARTFTALDASDSQLQGLVTNAAQTFGVFADNADALKATIQKLPATLTASQGSLAHLDSSLGPLSTLVTDIKPGAHGLVTDAPLLRGTLDRLVDVAPHAIATLATGATELPKLTAFLKTADPFLPKLTTALHSLAPMLACVRPYTPEIGGFLENWQGGPYDQVGHYGVMNLEETAILPGTNDTSAEAVAGSDGQITYAYPRVPGLNAGQPWFQPQCGAGKEALIAADDPEAAK